MLHTAINTLTVISIYCCARQPQTIRIRASRSLGTVGTALLQPRHGRRRGRLLPPQSPEIPAIGDAPHQRSPHPKSCKRDRNVGFILLVTLLTCDCSQDTNIVDNAETVYISSLALLKMLRHGRAGVPMEVMGLMLGEFVDDYTVRVVDVFAMPQSGTGVSVEAVDPVFQTKMMDMLRQTNR